MFEDSTFESTGRIKTRSRRWMFATLAFNGGILIALVLIPLIYPGALPRHATPPLLVAPALPRAETVPAQARTAQNSVRAASNEMHTNPFTAPRLAISIPKSSDLPPSIVAASSMGVGTPGADGANLFGARRAVTVVHPEVAGPVHVSSSLIEGMLIYKNVPRYPIIAKAMGVQGTIMLQATISKGGTIENLHVLSGPPMLQQAAIDAVKTWRYRPYTLNKEPVEVETTVSVIFRIDR
jgi:protein TonB